MTFENSFNILDRIQLLQRWILVQSFAYYELNENIASDFKYDENAMQLVSLMKENPDETNNSRYFEYFKDYCSSADDAHFTSGFDLLERVRKADIQLYRYLYMDAIMALESRKKHSLL